MSHDTNGSSQKQQALEATAEPAAVPVLSVRELTKLLFETWKRVDPKSNVALHPESYMANFADMARAALAAQGTQKGEAADARARGAVVVDEGIHSIEMDDQSWSVTQVREALYGRQT